MPRLTRGLGSCAPHSALLGRQEGAGGGLVPWGRFLRQGNTEGRPRMGGLLGTKGKPLVPGSKCFFLSSGLTRLKLKFKRGSLPPTMPLEFVGCIGGCDETLREILDLRFSRGSPTACQPATQPSGHLQASQSLNRIDSQHSHPRPPDTKPARPLTALAQNLPPPAAAGESNSVTCNCGQDALLLTVRKEGPNQGRQFYKCHGGSCNFFLWSDSSHPEAGRTPSSTSRPPGGSLGRPLGSGDHPGGFGRPGADRDGGTSCLCGQPAVRLTVQKDGPNKGRQFHTCTKPRERQCGFFEWVDENVAPGEEQFQSRAGGRVCSSLPQTAGSRRRQGAWWEQDGEWVALLFRLLTGPRSARQ